MQLPRGPQRVARLSAPPRVLLPAPFRNSQRIAVDDSPDRDGRDRNGDDGSGRIKFSSLRGKLKAPGIETGPLFRPVAKGGKGVPISRWPAP